MGVKRVIQFGYRLEVPVGIPLVDCRSIKNPFPRYRSPVEARAFVRSQPRFAVIVASAVVALKANDVIGVGCLFGVHRSSAVVEELQKLAALGQCPPFELENIGKEATHG